MLITYGVAAFSWLSSRSAPDASPLASSGLIPAHVLVLTGLGLQLALIIAQVLIKRRTPGHATGTQGLLVLELVGDGLTVLLFALGTYGAILNTAANI